MKCKCNSLVALFIATLFLSSCSIEKRVYNSGYNISWKKSNQISLNSTLVNKPQKHLSKSHTQSDNFETNLGSESIDIQTFDKEEIVISKKIKSDTQKKFKKTISKIKANPTIQLSSSINKLQLAELDIEEDDEETEGTNERKTSWPGIISFILLVIGLAVPIIIVAGILIFVAYLLSVAAIKGYFSEKGVYKYRLFAYLTFILGLPFALIIFGPEFLINLLLFLI